MPDHRRYPHATPNDTLFDGQWYLRTAEVSSVNAVGAWDRELGSTGVVIAVLDTGVLYDHPDLGRADRGGKLLPGFDFVTGTAQANDGDGRDADPSDPGDWVNSSDRSNSAFTNCELTGSSWHGTRVAGMIGALTNNAAGVAGLDWNSFILPVRVLGKCGGIDSDILAGMRWAAGLHVNGVADNPTPARVLNMSLGSDGACEPSYRDVIEELTARKVLVVISAGNEGTVVSSPANCPGVAAIAAIRHAGSKVGFSSLGPEVTIAAPGGNCVNINGGPCLFSLDTTSNTGSTVPASSFLHRPDQQQSRHQLFGAHRLGHRGPDAVAERESVHQPAAGAPARGRAPLPDQRSRRARRSRPATSRSMPRTSSSSSACAPPIPAAPAWSTPPIRWPRPIGPSPRWPCPPACRRARTSA